ncbi:cell division protein FtsQ/DivIB [Nocardiopsis suaedae]|uniref:FtsQ-type POTRA domain-containing protein n=1 Tax=Nocardiopsis suaedae TaxID=3018444 RepID=A0ABT4TVL0_9ACTN|nr:FtsQ-type POTRA domain-containing protein [Nocardiopsis suaedae]MDA2808250.1 FtsQ-type POTRA domain-containing protein [Nocardiopsis suaedae]
MARGSVVGGAEPGGAKADGAAPAEGPAPGGGEGGRPAPRSDPWKAAFIVLLIVALLAVVTWVLLGSRLLVVREVRVTGLERMDRAEVVRALAVPTGTPLARVDTEAAAGRAEGLRLAEQVEVERSWPASLTVRVAEREPRLAVRAGDGFRLVDHDGVRIEDADTRPAAYPLAQVRGEVEGNPGVAAAASAAEALDGALPESEARITSIDARDPASITVELDGGASVEWGDARDGARKARALEILVGEHPPTPDRVYDVSAVDMAVVR